MNAGPPAGGDSWLGVLGCCVALLVIVGLVHGVRTCAPWAMVLMVIFGALAAPPAGLILAALAVGLWCLP